MECVVCESALSIDPTARTRALQRVLLLTLGLNLAVAAVKLAVGLVTGALAAVADGFHSIVDASSNIVALVGIRLAGRPADADHPYGHRRYETVAALAVAALLLVTAVEVGRSIVERMLTGGMPRVSPLSLLWVSLTLPVNAIVAWSESRAARRLSSEALAADAAHTRADLLVTLLVLVSLLGALRGIYWLDAVVAVGVTAFILRAAFQVFRAASLILTDSVAANPALVREIAAAVPGVWLVDRVRSRGPADAVQVDLHVEVNPGMGTAQAHDIATEVERRLAERLPNVVDTVVHVEPGRLETPSEWEDLSVGLRALADGQGLGLHGLRVHVEPDGNYTAEFHLEVDAGSTLGQAHTQADWLEAQVKSRWPQIETVITHLEPLRADLAGEIGVVPALEDLKRRVTSIAESVVGGGTCRDVSIHNVGGHLSAALRVTLPADLPLVEAHARADAIEREVLAQEPRLERVAVHVEPP